MVSSQRVVVHHEPGNASVLKVEERPVPQRKQGEVLVKQYGTSVNPVDYKMRAWNKDNLPKVGRTRGLEHIGLSRSFWGAFSHANNQSGELLLQILGGDISGIVEEADSDSKVLDDVSTCCTNLLVCMLVVCVHAHQDRPSACSSRKETACLAWLLGFL